MRYNLIMNQCVVTGFSLELTWLRDWERPCDTGDNEQPLCAAAGRLGQMYAYNRKMELYLIRDLNR